jgi:hypothetical protein
VSTPPPDTEMIDFLQRHSKIERGFREGGLIVVKFKIAEEFEGSLRRAIWAAMDREKQAGEQP